MKGTGKPAGAGPFRKAMARGCGKAAPLFPTHFEEKETAVQKQEVGQDLQLDLTEGKAVPRLVRFAAPLMAGNLLQQLYNVADTFIVGRYLGDEALAAVGSSYTLMVFLTSILIGLCMGSSVYLSIQFGKKNGNAFQEGCYVAFLLIAGITLAINGMVYAGIDGIMRLMNIPQDVYGMMREYLWVIFVGLFATFLYNYLANCLRAVGNSLVPLLFLCVSALLNIGLDILFITVLHRGVAGAAEATVIAQYISAAGLLVYYLCCCRELHIRKENAVFRKKTLQAILSFSALTCIQQSIMNLGILMVQGLVNSFGTAVMSAFAVAVKVDTLAYSPVQDFGNAFSTFVAQNYGAGKRERIRYGMKRAVQAVILFCVLVSGIVFVFAGQLMGLFVKDGGPEVIAVGKEYLRIEGSFYFLIGLLFLLYGYFRAVGRPGVSVILTIVSLGTRVALAYLLSGLPVLGVRGIWISVPVGWFLADLAGAVFLVLFAGKGTGADREKGY